MILNGDVVHGIGSSWLRGTRDLRGAEPAGGRSVASTFVWSLVLLAVAFVPALFLPRGKPADPAAAPEDEVREPVAV
ncbi:MAG TPA: hypothetical protein VGX25_32315 [Actinophytocola sp.]|uniref:hypothetical protein n=1 Tax=Actinophytocola sp. TaxID=1872138 RepID=UPI002DDD60CC|nr:hypothetical protein [Actinophytocola sp.]HEV2784097.1 hypothetical protein [Actinophytocola sp.]